MSLVLLFARVVLALIFAVAAVGKLSDLDGFRQTLERFGLPRRAAHPAAWALPITELVVALALLFLATAWAAAIAATLLLSLFCVALATVLARGEAPPCNCFGSLGSARVGRGTLARNGMLLGLAVFVVVAGHEQAGRSAFAWVSADPALAILASLVIVAIAAQAVFSWQLFKQNGRLLVRVSELEAASSGGAVGRLKLGVTAPDFALPDLDGRTVTLDDLLARGRGALLFFTDPGCGHCEPVLPTVAAAQAERAGVPVAVISTGSTDANRVRAARYGIGQVLLQDELELSERYGLFGVPAAVLVDPAGLIASASVEGANEVAALLAGLFPPSAPPSNDPIAPRTSRREMVAQ